MNKVELRNIYNNVINKWNLAVIPELEEFVEFMNSDGTNINDPEEIESAADVYLYDFTEQRIKCKMLSEHKRIGMYQRDVKNFENNGGSIFIGKTLDDVIADERWNIEHLSTSEKKNLLEHYENDIEKYLKAWQDACVDAVKYGVVVDAEW